MNNETLSVYRPKLRNAFWAIGFFIVSVLSFIMLINSVKLPVGTLTEKIINIVVFILSWVLCEMTMFSAIHCFRNIFSGPSVILTNEKLFVRRKGEIAVSDIEYGKTELKNNSVTFYGRSGESVTVKSRMISFPVGTLAYAVKQRVELSEKKNDK